MLALDACLVYELLRDVRLTYCIDDWLICVVVSRYSVSDGGNL